MEWKNFPYLFQECALHRKYEKYDKNAVKCSRSDFNLCQTFAAISWLSATNEIFLNPVCAECKYSSRMTVVSYEKCKEDFRSMEGSKGVFFTPFSVLISFRATTQIELMKKVADRYEVLETVSCRKNEIFDWSEGKCKKISCKEISKATSKSFKAENTSNSFTHRWRYSSAARSFCPTDYLHKNWFVFIQIGMIIAFQVNK